MKIIDATWDNPSKWLTIEPDGVLYLCVNDLGANQRIYKSIDHGVKWIIEREGLILGSQIFKVMPTSAGFVATLKPGTCWLAFATALNGTWTETVPDSIPAWDHIDRVSGDMQKRTISETEGIWVAAWVRGLTCSVILLSTSGGVAFKWMCQAAGYTHWDNTILYLGKIGIFSLDTGWFYEAQAGGIPGGYIWGSYTAFTVETNRTWQKTGIAEYVTHRCRRPGIDTSNDRVVLTQYSDAIPGNGTWAYSDDHGESFTERDILAGMEHDPGKGVIYGDEDCTCDEDLVLAHLTRSVTTGIYRSDDFGVTWDRVHAALGTSYTNTGVQIDPNDPDYVYAWGPDGFILSVDGGVNWTEEGLAWRHTGPLPMFHKP